MTSGQKLPVAVVWVVAVTLHPCTTEDDVVVQLELPEVIVEQETQ